MRSESWVEIKVAFAAFCILETIGICPHFCYNSYKIFGGVECKKDLKNLKQN